MNTLSFLSKVIEKVGDFDDVRTSSASYFGNGSDDGG